MEAKALSEKWMFIQMLPMLRSWNGLMHLWLHATTK